MEMSKTAILIILVIVIILGIIFVPKMRVDNNIEININNEIDNTDNTNTNNNNMATKVKLTTNHGEIIIELYSKDMPITAGNFEDLVKKGTYNGVIFHRIIDGFMLQGGDPTGTGMGDPAIPNIKDEFTQTSLDSNMRGTISMANAGPNTGSSQFFINLVDNNFLDGRHPVFGKVVEGMDVVDVIAKVQTDSGDRPVEDVVIQKAEIV